ncbi:MAG: site-specific DNA-methyltransferase [Candidatus Poribacteria bacterium]|nr:site-specific DNA-methyltransferase [Candidatus Poribacteria bacterium]
MPTLEFKGKQHIYAHHLTLPYQPLEPDKNLSCNSSSINDNLIIHDDNRHALKALLPRYANRVNCIYIDPPYNTGNEGWIYNDNVNSPLMQAWFTENAPVDNEDLERHDKWLCMMWPRLHLLRELLAEDGVIFISIDDNEQHHLRMLMDEIFGAENFLANIIWEKIHSLKNDAKYFSDNHDFIQVYAKDKTSANIALLPRTEKMNRVYKNPDDDPRGSWTSGDLVANQERTGGYYEVIGPTGKSFNVPTGKHWAFSEENLKALIADNRIWFGVKGDAFPRLKRFLSEVQQGRKTNTIWQHTDVGHNQEAVREVKTILNDREEQFTTPKPNRLLMQILRLSSKDAIVLDSFAGSGTTAHAVLALNREDGGNRKFILVECEDYADTITAERVRRVINGVPNARDASLREGLGGSFTFCTLGEPLEIERMLTGEALPSYETLASYLLHMTAGATHDAGGLGQKNGDGLFHSGDEVDYYLLYEPNLEYLRSKEAMLNLDRAERIRDASCQNGKKAIVYAAGKYISQRDLTGMKITFCQLPHALQER